MFLPTHPPFLSESFGILCTKDASVFRLDACQGPQPKKIDSQARPRRARAQCRVGGQKQGGDGIEA